MSESGDNDGPSHPARMNREQLARNSARYIISPKVFETAGPEEVRLTKGAAPRAVALIIEINLDQKHADRESGHSRVADLVEKVIHRDGGSAVGSWMAPRESSRHHIFATLTLDQLMDVVRADAEAAKAEGRAPDIYKVWPDRPLEAYLDRSVRTIKGDACLRSFGSSGDGMVWAVADSGIQRDHPHFVFYENLELPAVGKAPAKSPRPGPRAPLEHKDFTGENDWGRDDYGHGTHVAGIIAGTSPRAWTDPRSEPPRDPARTPAVVPPVYRVRRERNERSEVVSRAEPCDRPIQGVAPKAKLVCLKVLDANGKGSESLLLSAIDYVSRVNDDGRWPRIHGLNLSLGYGFEAEWFAAGQSPLCVAVNRLVRQGVVVVAAAGNDGSAMIATRASPNGRPIGMDQSITDPGNAELAITVGSTHPEQPHTYGVSYFSSRGPTADGRQKPDLVAPGERIVSAASPGSLERLKIEDPRLKRDKHIDVPGAAYYREETGTSMAAPHVSGAIAAFLSVRSEFIGQPERVKEIFMGSATDLKRRRDFQGAGLVDLMRALQSV